jgi:hypothetical protein
MTAAGLPARVFGSAVKPAYVRLRRAFTGLLFECRYVYSLKGACRRRARPSSP